ncbi:hypothetical protein CEXT_87491 [Caerostris extrusa]|uniref:Uncharacterized protein n=1 Tax=Caerostris extrusa TaxID=172846 RepID=A0AAV4Y272_CAEEX|nr:hypothetical protein CEXT_87491 [Caerostris extrusa]
MQGPLSLFPLLRHRQKGTGLKEIFLSKKKKRKKELVATGIRFDGDNHPEASFGHSTICIFRRTQNKKPPLATLASDFSPGYKLGKDNKASPSDSLIYATMAFLRAQSEDPYLSPPPPRGTKERVESIVS